MSDRDEIIDLVATYAHAVDGRDLDRLIACFTDDGRIDFEGGQTSGEGHAGIRQVFEMALARPMLAPPATSTHLMCNTLVSVDGDTAHAETQAVAYLASPVSGSVVTRGLLYTDELRREADGWRIAHRTHRSIWQTEAAGEVH